MKKMQFIDLKGKYTLIKKKLIRDLDDLHYGNFILDKNINNLEKNLANLSGYKYCVLVSSGTCALLAALLSINLKKGDEILSPGFSWVSIVNISKLLGLKIKFCDINLENFNICIKDLKRKISKKTKAIIPASLFGAKINVKEINRIAKRHNIYVIEDNAQSFGENLFSKNTLKSEIMTTSFFPTKTLGSFGDMGAIFVDKKHLHEKLKSIRNHGNTKKKSNFGLNLRPQLFQAKVLQNILPNFKSELKLRVKIGKKYNQIISNYKDWNLPKANYSKENIFSYYNILVRDRKKTIKDLQKLGIPTKVYYSKALYEHEYLKKKPKKLKNVELVKKNILSLPIHLYNEKNMSIFYKKIKHYLKKK
jgi:UDP-2-acetamido-2-deoxy-ribo-hexuluronate aminotransferase